MRARADVVATKLGIILLLLPYFFLSFHVLFSQKGFAYDLEFLHAFLSNKKIRFSPKMGGTLPSPSRSSFLGSDMACEPVKLQFVGVAETGQTVGKRVPTLANAIF